MQKATILAIGAHPDDIEFGCGGTLIKYTERGHRLFLYIMTEGGLGAETSTRVEEQMASKAILGAEDIFWGGYRQSKRLYGAVSFGLMGISSIPSVKRVMRR
jgi:LmbE family N-acetylglucosaminyl deacetylase